MILTTVLCTFALFLLVGLWRASVKTQQLSRPWQEIAARIQPVQKDGIRVLALDYLKPTFAASSRSHEEIWELVGGVEGLKRMKENAEVLIALASYAQRWNHDDSVITTERMRRDGLLLRRAVVGLGLGLTCGYGQARILAYIHEAAGSYYLMRERLLALYQKSHEGIYPVLVDSI